MWEFLEASFRGPTLIASVLLLLCSLYWILVILGAFDVDVLHLDVHLDADMDSSLTGLGFLGLKFLNIGEIPVMIWASCFSLCLWMLSMLFNRAINPSDTQAVLLALGRDMVISAALTKVLTNPLRGHFVPDEPHPAEKMIGRTCVIATSQVDDVSGRAEFPTEGAPLLLNVRTRKGTLHKGELAEIIDFDPEKRVYLVASATREAST